MSRERNHEEEMGIPDAVVKGPSNEYFSRCEFEDACITYLDRIFPDWKSADKTYLFPPWFQYRYLAPSGKASGAIPFNKDLKADLKGDEAELNIFRSLEKFGREKKQPMFVFTKFEFKDFTKEVLSQNGSEDLEQSLQVDLMKNDLTREIDFIVVHKCVGVILIEVKARGIFKKDRYEKAMEQLRVGEQFILALLHATVAGRHIPIYKVVAFPNMSAHRQKPIDGYIDLRRENLGNHGHPDAFEQWWTKHFVEKCFIKAETSEILKLVAVLVGQRSVINAMALIPRDACTEVFEQIDKQKFLEKSYDQQEKKRKQGKPIDVASAVVKTERPELVVLTKQFLFLNPEQLRIWEGPTRQIFCGAPGSGKTILLQHKALECAKNQEKVVVVVPSPLDKLYGQFFARNKVSENVDVVDYTGFTSMDTRYPEPIKLNVFVDEFQVLLNIRKQELLDFFKSFLAKHSDLQCYQWIAYDVNQFPSGFKFSFNVPDFLSTLHKDHGFTHVPSLTTVMRCTSEVYKFLQQPLTRNSFSDLSSEMADQSRPGVSQQAVSDFRDYWDHSLYLGHHVCGPQVTKKEAVGSDVSRYLYCSKIVQDEINMWAKEDDSYYYYKVAVLLEAGICPIDELSSFLEKDGIPVCCVGSTENAVVVDEGDNARSYEWPVVIVICMMPEVIYVPSSRAVTRLIIIEWKWD